MKSLPTPLTTAQVDRLVSDLLKLPSATVFQPYGMSDIVRVSATKRATGEKVTVFRAVQGSNGLWHAMAAEGLITTNFEG